MAVNELSPAYVPQSLENTYILVENHMEETVQQNIQTMCFYGTLESSEWRRLEVYSEKSSCALAFLISREIILPIEGKVTRRSDIFFTISSGHNKINLMTDQRIHSCKMNELTIKKPLPRIPY